MDKVVGGTPRGSKSLCSTCRAAHITRGINNQEVVFCRQITPYLRVQFPVETCTVYDDKRVPSLYQMEQIAWDITSRSRGAMGFSSGTQLEITITPPSERNPGQPLPPVTGIEERHD